MSEKSQPNGIRDLLIFANGTRYYPRLSLSLLLYIYRELYSSKVTQIKKSLFADSLSLTAVLALSRLVDLLNLIIAKKMKGVEFEKSRRASVIMIVIVV